MDQVVLFVLLGLGTGALIAGIALGVVLTYRGSGIINLATGAVAMVAGYSFWSLKTDFFGFTLGTAPALVVTLLVCALVGVLMEVLVFRPLRTASPLAKLVASLGILLTLQSAMLLELRTCRRRQPPEHLPEQERDRVRRADPGQPVLAGGDRDRDHAAADGGAIAGPVSGWRRGRHRRTRSNGHAGRPVAEPAVDREHDAGGCRGRRDGGARGASGAGRFDVAAACRSFPRSRRRCSPASRRSGSPARRASRSGSGSRCCSTPRRCPGFRPTTAIRFPACRRC